MYGTSNLIAFAASFQRIYGVYWSRRLLSQLFHFIDRNNADCQSFDDADLMEIFGGNGAYVMMFVGFVRADPEGHAGLWERERRRQGIPLNLLIEGLFSTNVPDDVSLAMSEGRYEDLPGLFAMHMTQAQVSWDSAWLGPATPPSSP